MWKVLDTGSNSAQKNMRIDAKLLEELRPDDLPILHFYEWEQESATYGYFLRPEKYLDLIKVQRKNLALARRPTGGGIVFHTCDLAFSVLVPVGYPTFSYNTLDNYHFINSYVKNVVKIFFQIPGHLSLLPEDPVSLDESARHFCMAKPTIYDVMINNRKIAGAAQRKRKSGYLHQGSIAIGMPRENFLKEILLPNTRVFDAMRLNTCSILGDDYTLSELQEVRTELRHLLTNEILSSS